MMVMSALYQTYTIVQYGEAYFNCYDLVSLAVTGKWAEKRRHNETESTTEDKDGDNSDNLSDQNDILT